VLGEARMRTLMRRCWELASLPDAGEIARLAA